MILLDFLHKFKIMIIWFRDQQNSNFLMLKLVQVAYLQAQLMQAKAQLAQNLIDQSSRNAENQWISPGMGLSSPIPVLPNYMNYYSNISPQSSLDSIEHHSDGITGMLEIQSRDEVATFQPYSKKRPSQTDLSELQALALRMMKNEN